MEGSYELRLTNNVQPIMAAEGSAEKTLNRIHLSIYFDTSRIVLDSVLPHFPLHKTWRAQTPSATYLGEYVAWEISIHS